MQIVNNHFNVLKFELKLLFFNYKSIHRSHTDFVTVESNEHFEFTENTLEYVGSLLLKIWTDKN